MPDYRSNRLNRHDFILFAKFYDRTLKKKWPINKKELKISFALTIINIKGRNFFFFFLNVFAWSQISMIILINCFLVSSFYIRSIRVGIVELFLKYFDSSQFLFILMAPDVVRSTLFASSLWLTRSCRRVWNSFSPVCTTKTIFSVPQDPSQCCSFLSEFEHKKYQFFSITSISIASKWEFIRLTSYSCAFNDANKYSGTIKINQISCKMKTGIRKQWSEGTHQREKQIILINRINQKREVINVRGLTRSIKANTKQHRWKIYGICRFNNL